MKSMIIGTIVKLERLNNSVWGNPRYKATIKDECGFYYHVTKAGNNIIDDIDPIA